MLFLYKDAHKIDSVEGGYSVIFQGVVIYKSNAVGEESVIAFFSDYVNGNAVLEELFGFFWIFATNNHEKIFFCDNSSMLPLYYSVGGEFTVSDSLISLARHLELTQENLDTASVLSFLEFGFCFSGSTLFDSVKRCSGKIIYRITNNDVIECIEKKINPINVKFSASEFSKRLTAIIKSFRKGQVEVSGVDISKSKIVIDCTGGFDSRLIIGLGCLENLDFDLFVRGHPNCADITVAKEIASILGKELIISPAYAISDFSLENLKSLWMRLDGTYSLFDGKQLLDAYELKKKLGFDYSLGGFAGGEYFRNYVVLRRGKKGKYAQSLCEYSRIKLLGITDTVYKKYEDIIENVVNSCDDTSKMAANVDLYCYEIFPHRSGPVYGSSVHLCPSYGPLGERSFATWARRLPFYKKWYSLIFRKILYKKNKKLAMIKTIYGTNLSLSPANLLHDVLKDVITFSKRVFSKLFTHRMWKPNVYNVSATTNCMELKNSPLYLEMINCINELNLFDSKDRLLEVSDIVLDRFLTLYLWIHFLKSKKSNLEVGLKD